MSINRGMEKEDVVHVYMEYYSAIKENGLMPFAITWMDLEIVILSEITPSQKDKCHVMLHIRGV